MQGMIDLILATDMTNHSALMSQWTAILEEGVDYTKDEHLKMVCVRERGEREGREKGREGETESGAYHCDLHH